MRNQQQTLLKTVLIVSSVKDKLVKASLTMDPENKKEVVEEFIRISADLEELTDKGILPKLSITDIDRIVEQRKKEKENEKQRQCR